MNPEETAGVSPEDRPDRGLEALLQEHGLMHYSTKLAMEGAMLQGVDDLKQAILNRVAQAMQRGEAPATAEAYREWLRAIIQEEWQVFEERMIEAEVFPEGGLPPEHGA